MTLFFPILQIILCIGAGTVYAFAGDWKHAVYWFAAPVLTGAVTSL